jgi:hypothetical protein
MRLLLQDMSIETGTVEVWIRAKKEEPGWPTITVRDASAEKQEPLLSEVIGYPLFSPLPHYILCP